MVRTILSVFAGKWSGNALARPARGTHAYVLKLFRDSHDSHLLPGPAGHHAAGLRRHRRIVPGRRGVRRPVPAPLHRPLQPGPFLPRPDPGRDEAPARPASGRGHRLHPRGRLLGQGLPAARGGDGRALAGGHGRARPDAVHGLLRGVPGGRERPAGRPELHHPPQPRPTPGPGLPPGEGAGEPDLRAGRQRVHQRRGDRRGGPGPAPHLRAGWGPGGGGGGTAAGAVLPPLRGGSPAVPVAVPPEPHRRAGAQRPGPGAARPGPRLDGG